MSHIYIVVLQPYIRNTCTIAHYYIYNHTFLVIIEMQFASKLYFYN